MLSCFFFFLPFFFSLSLSLGKKKACRSLKMEKEIFFSVFVCISVSKEGVKQGARRDMSMARMDEGGPKGHSMQSPGSMLMRDQQSFSTIRYAEHTRQGRKGHCSPQDGPRLRSNQYSLSSFSSPALYIYIYIYKKPRGNLHMWSLFRERITIGSLRYVKEIGGQILREMQRKEGEKGGAHTIRFRHVAIAHSLFFSVTQICPSDLHEIWHRQHSRVLARARA